jgi:hypothetical protein
MLCNDGPPLPTALACRELDACFVVKDKPSKTFIMRMSRNGEQRPNCSPKMRHGGLPSTLLNFQTYSAGAEMRVYLVVLVYLMVCVGGNYVVAYLMFFMKWLVGLDTAQLWSGWPF